MASSRIGGRGTTRGRGVNRRRNTRLRRNQRKQAQARAGLRRHETVQRFPVRGGVARG